ncbi:MAG: capsular biosynthesis protein [Pikeienuella sp.]
MAYRSTEGIALTDRNRHALLLQGPSSFFMAQLGKELRAKGMRVSRIHLCPGDWLMWRGGGGRIYRGSLTDWPEYVGEFMQAEGITDLICLGSGRAYHRAAIDAAPANVRVTSIEHGYLRPNRLLVEPGGSGGDSSFPRDWATIRRLAELQAPEADQVQFKSSFLEYAVLDVVWNLSNVALGWFMTPGYQRHSVDHPLIEYAGWIRKGVLRRTRLRALAKAEAKLAAHKGPLFILPLQLETDYQIRFYGSGRTMRQELERLIGSFAARAPKDAMFVVKVHPLDNGNAPWQSICKTAAMAAGVPDRVVYFDGGNLDQMIAKATGVVTVNSTVGLTAVLAGCPVQTLGWAIYDLPCLTHQGGVDKFWNRPTPPTPEYVEVFTKALESSIHVHGAFDGSGVQPGAKAIADKITASPPYPAATKAQL